MTEHEKDKTVHWTIGALLERKDELEEAGFPIAHILEAVHTIRFELCSARSRRWEVVEPGEH